MPVPSRRGWSYGFRMTIGKSPEHAVFDLDVGTWDADILVTPQPDAPPVPSRGVAKNRLACGGRWLITDFENETSGFEGHGVYGYDPAKQKYVGTWVDNMRSFLAVAEGKWDKDTMTMTYTTEAEIGGKKVKWREVTDKKQPDVMVFKQYFPKPGGGESVMMEVTYRRRR